MKKFTKVSLIIVLVLVCVGVTIGAIGFAIGGTRMASGLVEEKVSNFLQHRTNTEITYNSDFDIHMDNWAKEDEKIYTGIIKNEFIATNEEVMSMEFNIGAAELNVLPSSTDNYIVESNTKGEYRCYVKDGVLILEGIQHNNLTIQKNETITLFIPENAVLDSISMSVGAGDVEIETMKANQIEISIGAGQLKVQNLIADDLKLEVAVGECVINQMNLEQGKIDISMGDLTVKGNITKDLEVNCTMGNATLELDGTEKDFNYEIDCAMGNVNVLNSGITVILGENNKNNNADKTFKISCAMGNVEVDFR